MNDSKPKAWVGVVSQAHVLKGVAGGFAQLCHGKRAPLAAMRPGDWLTYYSPSTQMRGGEPLRAFTAIGRVVGEGLTTVTMPSGDEGWRRNIDFEATGVVPITSVPLRFIRENPAWGLLARRGHFEIALDDLERIRAAMLHLGGGTDRSNPPPSVPR